MKKMYVKGEKTVTFNDEVIGMICPFTDIGGGYAAVVWIDKFDTRSFFSDLTPNPTLAAGDWIVETHERWMANK